MDLTPMVQQATLLGQRQLVTTQEQLEYIVILKIISETATGGCARLIMVITLITRVTSITVAMSTTTTTTLATLVAASSLL